MIPELIRALAPLDPTAEEVADALWLAERFREYAGAAPPAAARPEPPTGPPEAQRPPEPAVAPPSAPRPGDGPPAYRPDPQAGWYVASPGSPAAALVRSPSVPALPHARQLARALRPLRVTAPSPVRWYLDEEATARGFAETGVWAPVTRPAPEPRLDLAIVVDAGESMRIWQRVVAELQTLLVQLGAFRDVRLWRLDPDGGRLLLSTEAGSLRSPDELIDPTWRRMVLVVSDCIGPAWQDGSFAGLLERWGRTVPVAIIQPLPQRLWPRCAAALQRVTFRAERGGAPNGQLTVRSREPDVDLPGGLAVPVLELRDRWLLPWARTVAYGGSDTKGVVLFTGDPAAAGPESEPEPYAMSAEVRVQRFRASSSPTAFRLASFLAAAPLQLPIMRLVQAAMLPESRPAHLAEVFLGDLLRRVDLPATAGPEEMAYEFHDGVRAALLSGLAHREIWDVQRAVWSVIRDRIGSSLDFPALLKAIEQDEEVLPPDQQFAQVAAQVLTHLGGRYSRIARRLAAADVRGEGGRAWGRMPPRNPDFTGRDDLLERLREQLGRSMTVLLPETAGSPGGEGKSQLAVEYAYQYAADYEFVWWIPAEQPTLARSSLAGLVRWLGTPEIGDFSASLEHAFRLLRSGERYARWLLIYDDAQAPDELLPLLPTVPGESRPPYGDVLVTSRNPEWAESLTEVRMGIFARAESVALLRRRVPALSPGQADELAELVGDLPLAVDLVAGWLAVTGAAPEEYVRLFGEKLAGVPDTLAGCLALNFDRLATENADAARLLELWSFLGPEPVTHRLLRSGNTAELPEPVFALLADDERLRTAMRDIGRYRLARFDEQADSLQVHRLVQTMLDRRLTDRDREHLGNAVHALLAAATPDSGPYDENTWRRRAEITPHVIPARLIDSHDPRTRDVVLDQALYLYVLGDFASSRLLAERAMETWEEPGHEDEYALRAARLMANALRALGEMHQAAVLNETTLNRMRRALGPEHVDTLYAANGFGADLRFRGRFREAYELDQQTWRIIRRLPEDDTVTPHLAANNVAIDARLLGRFQEALDIDREVLDELRQPGGERDLFRSTHNLARDLHGLGRYKEAGRLQSESLHRIPAALGTHHALVLQAKMSHAVTLREDGEYEAARRLAEETLAAHLERFGTKHPNTLAAKWCLARACTSVGDAARGRRLSEEALDDYREVMASDHPFVYACASGLGIARRAQGDIEAALDIDRWAYTTARDGTLGPRHYYTLATAVGLAHDLHLIGEVAEAVELSDATLEGLRAEFGLDHAHSLACEHNDRIIRRAATLPDRDDRDIVTLLSGALGRRHPKIAIARAGRLLECDIEPTAL